MGATPWKQRASQGLSWAWRAGGPRLWVRQKIPGCEGIRKVEFWGLLGQNCNSLSHLEEMLAIFIQVPLASFLSGLKQYDLLGKNVHSLLLFRPEGCLCCSFTTVFHFRSIVYSSKPSIQRPTSGMSRAAPTKSSFLPGSRIQEESESEGKNVAPCYGFKRRLAVRHISLWYSEQT